MFCHKCGTKNPDEAAFCSECGQQLVSRDGNPVTPQYVKQNQPVENTPVQPEVPFVKATPEQTPFAPQSAPDAAPVYGEAPVYNQAPSYNEAPVYNEAVAYQNPFPEQNPVQNPVPDTMYQPTPMPVPDVNMQRPTPAFSTNGVIDAIKKLASSSLMVVVSSMFSAAIIVSILTSGAVFDGLLNALLTGLAAAGMSLNDLGYQLGIGYIDLFSIFNTVKASAMVSTAISMLPSIVIAIGLWVTVSTGKNKHSNTMSTGGLTAISVIYIISLIFACLPVVLVTALFAIVVAGAELPWWIILIPLVILAIIIVYYMLIIKSVSSCKRSIYSGQAIGNASALIGVLLFISGFFQIISGVLSIVIFGLGYTVSAVLTAITNILFGVLIFKYRGIMNRNRKY